MRITPFKQDVQMKHNYTLERNVPMDIKEILNIGRRGTYEILENPSLENGMRAKGRGNSPLPFFNCGGNIHMKIFLIGST
jgi:hypothetical protein